MSIWHQYNEVEYSVCLIIVKDKVFYLKFLTILSKSSLKLANS